MGDNWGDCADIPEPMTSNKWYTVNLPYNTYTISFDVVNAVRTALGETVVFAPYDGTTNTNILASKIYSVEDNTTYQSKGANINGRFYFTYTGKIQSLGCFWRSNSYQLLTSGSIENIMIEVGDNPTKQFKPYNGHTTTIPFTDAQGNPIEVYGGECDVVNGGGSDALKEVNVSDFTIQREGGDGTTTTARITGFENAVANTAISNRFSRNIASGVGRMVQTASLIYLVVSTSELSSDDTSGLIEWFNSNPTQIVYELATPSTFYTQPTSIKSQSGVNNVWGDTGDVEELSYFSKLSEG